MTRISKLSTEPWDPRIRGAVNPEGLTDLEQGLTRIFAQTPDLALGLMGFGRLAATCHVVEELPEAFQASQEPISPWGNDARVVR